MTHCWLLIVVLLVIVYWLDNDPLVDWWQPARQPVWMTDPIIEIDWQTDYCGWWWYCIGGHYWASYWPSWLLLVLLLLMTDPLLVIIGIVNRTQYCWTIVNWHYWWLLYWHWPIVTQPSQLLVLKEPAQMTDNDPVTQAGIDGRNWTVDIGGRTTQPWLDPDNDPAQPSIDGQPNWTDYWLIVGSGRCVATRTHWWPSWWTVVIGNYYCEPIGQPRRPRQWRTVTARQWLTQALNPDSDWTVVVIDGPVGRTQTQPRPVIIEVDRGRWRSPDGGQWPGGPGGPAKPDGRTVMTQWPAQTVDDWASRAMTQPSWRKARRTSNDPVIDWWPRPSQTRTDQAWTQWPNIIGIVC